MGWPWGGVFLLLPAAQFFFSGTNRSYSTIPESPESALIKILILK